MYDQISGACHICCCNSSCAWPLQYTKSGLISISRLSMNSVGAVADIGTVKPGHRTMRRYGECQLGWFCWWGGLGDLVGGNGLLMWAFLVMSA